MIVVRRFFALVLIIAFSSLAFSSDPEFGTYFLHGKDIDTIAKSSIAKAFSYETDLYSSVTLEKDEYGYSIAGREILLLHFYLSGEGFSEDKNESAQYLVVKEITSDYLIFNSGFFMPECGSQSFNVDSIRIESDEDNSDYIVLSIERILPGCLGVTGTITNYHATYDLRKGKLLNLVYDGHSL